MGLPEGPKSFKTGLVVLIQYRLWRTPSHPASLVAVGITLYAKASSLKIDSILRKAHKFVYTTEVLKVTDMLQNALFAYVPIWSLPSYITSRPNAMTLCYTLSGLVWYYDKLLTQFLQPYSLWNNTITGYNGACAKVTR